MPANIRFKEDATFNNIREAVNWIRDIANNKLYKNTARFIFYYSGHGVPNELTRSMYLLPKDGVAANIANTGYKISDLYDALAEAVHEHTRIFCLRGHTDVFEDAQADPVILVADKQRRIQWFVRRWIDD